MLLVSGFLIRQHSKIYAVFDVDDIYYYVVSAEERRY
jgi:hypothetical protein